MQNCLKRADRMQIIPKGAVQRHTKTEFNLLNENLFEIHSIYSKRGCAETYKNGVHKRKGRCKNMDRNIHVWRSTVHK